MAQMTKKKTTKRKSGSSGKKGNREKAKGSSGQDEASQAKEPTLHEQVQATIKKLQSEDPGLKQLMKKAHGYAVFPSVAKAALVVGGAYGLGEVYEQGKVIGHATIGQLTIGVQVGGDTFDELIVFEDEEPFKRFKESRMKFAANASAVLVKAGAAASSNFEKGATVFVYAEGGMLLELAIGGQKFRFKPGKPGDEVSDDEEKGASSQSDSGEEDEESGDEDDSQDSGSTLGKATKALQFARNHPVWAALIGAGVAFYAVSRLMGGSSSDSSDEDESDEDYDEDESESSQGDEEDDEQDSDDDREEDDEQDEDSDEDEEDEESDDEDEEDEDDDEEDQEEDEEEESSRPSRSRR